MNASADPVVGDEVIAVDIGGTKIAAALIDPVRGAVHHRLDTPTDARRGGCAVLDDVVRLVTQLVDRRHRFAGSGRPIPVGLAVPEIVDASGVMRSRATLDWSPGDVDRVLPGALLVGDVHAAAEAEVRFGIGRGCSSFVFVSVGSGVSTAFVVDGRVWRGVNGAALVAASSPISIPSDLVRSGDIQDELMAFVPEAVASGYGIARLAVERGILVDEAGGAREVERLAAAGDREAFALLEEAAQHLAGIVGRVIDLLDPGVVVIGGGLGLARGVQRQTFDRLIPAAIWSDTARRVRIVDAALGVDSALIGAAVACHRLNRPEV